MADRDPAVLRALEEKARSIAKLVGARVPAGVGFTLLLFDFTPVSLPGVRPPPGWMTYISSARREDVAQGLIECVANMRRQELGTPSDQDVDDVAAALAELGGVSNLDRDTLRRLAVAAIALGASPGLARVDLETGGGRG